MTQFVTFRRRLGTLLSAVMLCGGMILVPDAIQKAHAGIIVAAYTVDDSVCQQTTPPPDSVLDHVDSGTTAICILMVGASGQGDSFSVSIYNGANTLVTQIQPMLVYAASGLLAVSDVQYTLNPGGPWPDGTYHSNIMFNGSIVYTDDWAVAPAAPTATVTPIPPTNTPIPPTSTRTATPVPPTATSTPVPADTITATVTPAPPTLTSTTTPTTKPAVTGCGELTLQNAVRCIAPSLVGITVHHGSKTSVQTGFVVRSDRSGAYILTSRGGLQGATAGMITITTTKAKVHPTVMSSAVSAGPAGNAGLALLRVSVGGLTPLPWGTASTLRVGMPVCSAAFGTTASLGPQVVVDAITAVRQDRHDGLGRVWFIYKGGLSTAGQGGPLVGTNGAVVGIALGSAGKGQVFALSADQAKAAAAILFTRLTKASHS